MYRKSCFLNRFSRRSRSFSTMAVVVCVGHCCRDVCSVAPLCWVSWVSQVLSFLEHNASLASEHHVLPIVLISPPLSLWLSDATGSFLLILSSDCQSASPLAQRGYLLRNRLSSLPVKWAQGAGLWTVTEMVIVEERLGGGAFLHYQCQSFRFLNWFLFVSVSSFWVHDLF